MSNTIVPANTPEQNRFKSINEFKECIIRGGELVFTWKSRQYGVFLGNKGFCIAKIDGAAEKWCDTADEVLEYIVGGDRLRDVITKVTVTDRTI